jgi:tRNA (guanosine-2'-O-)-methyltransferase
MIDKELVNLFESYLTDKRKTLYKKVIMERTRHFTVVLEDICQTHNTSAVLRTCDVFGVQDIHTIENKYIKKLSKSVVKGSQKWITSKRYKSDGNNTKICFEALREKGYQIIAITPHHTSFYYKILILVKKRHLYLVKR